MISSISWLIAATWTTGCVPSAAAQYTRPHVVDSHEPAVAQLNGTRLVNHGLVGVGRIPASMLDAQGSTFGSVSAMAIVPGTWRYDAVKGEYSGIFLTLPDRGRNNPEAGVYIDYQNRVQKLGFTFVPVKEGERGGAQNQIAFEYEGLTLLHEADGTPIVGNDPGGGRGRALGSEVPRKDGRLAMDGEGLVVLPAGKDGANGASGWFISDEYGAAIYRFDADGVLRGVVRPPNAVMPMDEDEEEQFNSVRPPTTGRRNNHGMEGLTLTPSGKYLLAMIQDAAVQDSEEDETRRRFCRVMRYAVQADGGTVELVGHYVMELPTFRSKGDSEAPNKTAAQSEILALSDTQFLVLSRDGYGRGDGKGRGMVYKCVLLADLSSATNLVGTPQDGLATVAPGGELQQGVTAVAYTEAVNMLNLADLRRFGLNIDLNKEMPQGDENTLAEKWEGLCLLPDTATADPGDYFLFIANDNDFLTTDGVMKTVDGKETRYHDGVDVDTMVLVYRVGIEQRP